MNTPDPVHLPSRRAPRFFAPAVRATTALWLATRLFAADIGPTFPTPEAAADALVEAAGSLDRDAVRNLFGLHADELLAVDQVQATNELTEFNAAARERRHLVRESDSRVVLEVGTDAWPFPIPIVQRNQRWFFDTDAGREELLNRRIGRNELAVLEVMRAFVDAQREYADRDRDDDDVREFAQRLASSPGQKDGLYWPPDLDGEVSPLGPLAARARSQGYRRRSTDDAPEPFHGYYFKILTRQGNHAPGGRHGYLINGNMIAGFAFVAWPARYGESGIMTFIVNQQGRVYQKDLGPRTARLAGSMTTYDPGQGWNLSPN